METQIHQAHKLCSTLGRSCASPPHGGVPAPTAAEPVKRDSRFPTGNVDADDSDDPWCCCDEAWDEDEEWENDDDGGDYNEGEEDVVLNNTQR